jgi:hypothetical protein
MKSLEVVQQQKSNDDGGLLSHLYPHLSELYVVISTFKVPGKRP